MVNLLWTKPIHYMSSTPHIHLCRVSVAVWLVSHQTNPMSKGGLYRRKGKTGELGGLVAPVPLAYRSRRTPLLHRRSVPRYCYCAFWWRFIWPHLFPGVAWAAAPGRCGGIAGLRSVGRGGRRGGGGKGGGGGALYAGAGDWWRHG